MRISTVDTACLGDRGRCWSRVRSTRQKDGGRGTECRTLCSPPRRDPRPWCTGVSAAAPPTAILSCSSHQKDLHIKKERPPRAAKETPSCSKRDPLMHFRICGAHRRSDERGPLHTLHMPRTRTALAVCQNLLQHQKQATGTRQLHRYAHLWCLQTQSQTKTAPAPAASKSPCPRF